MLPIQKNITLTRGDSHKIGFSFVNSLRNAIDITGTILLFTVKSSINDTTAVIMKADNSHIDSNNGISAITINNIDTYNLQLKNYYYDIRLIDSYGNYTTLLSGKLSITPEISKSNEIPAGDNQFISETNYNVIINVNDIDVETNLSPLIVVRNYEVFNSRILLDGQNQLTDIKALEFIAVTDGYIIGSNIASSVPRESGSCGITLYINNELIDDTDLNVSLNSSYESENLKMIGNSVNSYKFNALDKIKVLFNTDNFTPLKMVINIDVFVNYYK
jgi:hypothetical protein